MPLDIDERIKRGNGSYTKGSEPPLSDLSEDDVARGLAEAEQYANAGVDTAKNNSAASDISDQESTPKGDWAVNRSGVTNQAKEVAKVGLKGLTKNKSAMGGIIGLIFGTGLGFSALFSPGMLIVHMKEVLVDRFDTASLSLNARSGKLLQAKIDGSTSGKCGTVISIGCRFSTLSEKNVRNLKAAGIDIEPSTKNSLGRYKPSSYKFTDSTGTIHSITSKDFASFSKSHPEFRAALKKAYNPRFAAFSGSVWKRISSIYGVNKQPNEKLNGTSEENADKLNNAAKNGDEDLGTKTSADFLDEENGCDQECADNRASEYNNAAREIDEGKPTASKAGREALEAVGRDGAGSALSKVTSIVKVTGVVDNACTAYGAVRAVGMAAKTIRAIQLARYAMIFLKAADEIKAGTADAETIAYLGGVLTNIAYDVSSTNQRIKRYGSATDSFGYKFAAFGDASASNNSMSIASQYLAGGGFTGELISVTDAILAVIPGGRKGAQTTCGNLANPWVQVGSFIAGAALMIVPGGQAVSGGKLAAQAALGIAFQVGLALLPTLLADIVAGTVTDNIDGEHSGNAITSGAGNMLGALNRESGNPVLTKDQAVDYFAYQQEMIAMQAEEDRATLSPFDTSSRHTFLGTIVSSLTPYIASSASVPSKFFSSLGMSLTSIFGSAKAASAADYEKTLNVCQDFDYMDMDLATDPFCNVVYAMPSKYLNRDPMTVLDSVAGQYNDETGEPSEGSELKSFLDTCIQRTDPLGYSGADSTGDDGEKCKINDDNANYYLYWIDFLAEEGMSGEAS